MNYTIACTEETHTGFAVAFEKNGNAYNIVCTQSFGEMDDDRKLFIKGYENAQDAKAAYMRVVTCILDGTYNFEDRCKIMKGE